MNKIIKRQADICIALVQEIDRSVVDGRQPADQVLARIFRRHREYGARDRRLFSNTVFSWFRWRGWLKTPTNVNITAANLLDAIEIYPQMEYMIAETGLSGVNLKPLGSLTLEEKAEYLQYLLNSPSLQIDQVGRDSLSRRLFGRTGLCGPTSFKFPSSELVPAWFFDSVFVPEQKERNLHFRQCIVAFQARPPTWLRLRSGGEDRALSMLAKAGYEIVRHALLKQAVFIKTRPMVVTQCALRDCHSRAYSAEAKPLAAKAGSNRESRNSGNQYLDFHFHGNDSKEVSVQNFQIRNVNSKYSKKFDASQFPTIEVQDLASQCVGICCSPKAGEKWWDVCAGSGGKSLHLADLMQDKGLILATDVRPAILAQLSRRVKSNKYRSIKTAIWDGTADPAPGTYFNGVLVDAPCSGLGTWHRNPDARWRISAGQIQDYARIQMNLLQIAAKKVSAGGRLVYSTCTLTKAENIDVITTFLEQNREFLLAELINPLNREPANGIIWIWPWEWNSNGMFIAVMKKT